MSVRIEASDQWDYVERIAQEGKTPPANFLLRNLEAIEERVTRNPYGKLQFVTRALHPFDFLAAFATTEQCGGLRVEFFFSSLPRELDATSVLLNVIEHLRLTAVSHKLSLVFLPLHSGSQCILLKDTLSSLASSSAQGPAPNGATRVDYIAVPTEKLPQLYSLKH